MKIHRLVLDFIIIWVLIGICIACSPIKRYNRLINKYPLLEDTMTTIRVVHDTITTITTDKQADTSFTVQNKKDTVFWVINHDSIIIKYRRYFDTVMIQAECPPDTIIEIRKVPYITKTIRAKKPTKKENNFPWIWITVIVVSGGIVYGTIRRLLR